MHQVTGIILTREHSVWTLSFICPACTRQNIGPPVPDTALLRCEHCGAISDGKAAEVTLIDLTPPTPE